jgi:hypothetical protein
MKIESNENPMGSISAEAILNYDAERPAESKLDHKTEADIKFFFHCMEDKIHLPPLTCEDLFETIASVSAPARAPHARRGCRTSTRSSQSTIQQ